MSDTTQTETIVWHDFYKEKPEISDIYLISVANKYTDFEPAFKVVNTGQARWSWNDERWSKFVINGGCDKRVIAWAHIPKGWKQ